MTQGKRGPGRPPGASRLNEHDAKILDQMAGIIVRQPMNSTAALRQLGINDYAPKKRLQRKWRSDRSTRIQAAKDRAQRQREQLQAMATAVYDKLYAIANSPDMVAAAKIVNKFATHPAWEELRRQLEAASKNPFMQQIRAIGNSPELKCMTEWVNSPEARQLRGFEAIANNPEFKRMNEWMNSSEVRRLRDLNQNLQTVYPSLFFIPPSG